MTDQGGDGRSGPRGRAALKQIDLQLEGLLGKLGDTLGEMIDRLEDGETGELRRSHEVQTPRGPVRAEAGLRVRMGLGDAAARQDSPSVAQPVRPRRAAPSGAADDAGRRAPGDDGSDHAEAGAQAAAKEDAPRALRIDAYPGEGRWILSADMPGVSLPEVTVTVADGQIAVASAGRRRYAGRHPLPVGADPSDMDIALRNGVLEITMGMSGDGGAA